jgi:hypothetical protein
MNRTPSAQDNTASEGEACPSIWLAANSDVISHPRAGALEELQETFYARALEGDVQCSALVTKIIERRSLMRGLQNPQTAYRWGAASIMRASATPTHA